jgi:hypothetical protein
MIPAIVLLVLALFYPSAGAPPPGGPTYAPLWLYQGAWRSTDKNGKIDRLENQCSLLGVYFACQQSVNGKTGSLIVFIPTGKPGGYHTQAVLPEGWAAGRGDLVIEGDRWTYSSKDVENDKTTYYRTTNVFTGNDKIHYEQSESADGVTWKVTNSGDEQRLLP